MFVCACVTALLYQILSLHSKMLMVKSHAELWSNITGLSVSTDSKRSVNYVYDVLLYCCWLCPYHRNLFCCSTKIISSFPSLSLRHHRSSGDCLEGKRENYHVCSVQYCVQQLCTVQCTHIRTDLTVLDWVLSHWAHFTVFRFIFMVALCNRETIYIFIL